MKIGVTRWGFSTAVGILIILIALLTWRVVQVADGVTIRNTLVLVLVGGLFSFTLLTMVYRMLRQELVYREKMTVAMIQSEKMAGIGQFAAGVAHDINNPIGVVLGFSQAAMRRLTDTDPLMIAMKSIEREALRCKTLVQNLLVFSRSRGSTSTMKLEDLNRVVENALELVATLARHKKVNLSHPPNVDMPLISVDRNQIQQVIINLCTNAIDAMPNGGILRIGIVRRPDHVEVSIQDTGAGIPPEVREHMFEAFFTTKEEGKGTGLGLSITANILKAHHGKIDVQSEVGKGTTFTMKLPFETHVPSSLSTPA